MTTYERLMKEAKEEFEKAMKEKKNKLKVKQELARPRPLDPEYPEEQDFLF